MFFVVKASQALVLVIVILNDFEMKTIGSRDKPKCARCQGHGKRFLVKGHKRSCDYRDCVCRSCQVVAKASQYRAQLLAIMRGMKNGKTRKTGGTHSNEVVESDALLSLHCCNSAQIRPASRAPNAIHNIIPLPQPQHQLARQCQQYFENCTPLNTADTIVEEGVLPSISGKTQPVVSGDSLSSSSSTSGRNYPDTYINIARSITQPPQQYQQCPLECNRSFTNYASQLDAATPMTNLPSMIDWSGSLSSSSTTNTTVPNVPSSTNPSPNTKTQFTQYHPANKAESPGTDFHSIVSLSLSSTSENNRTPPVTSSDWTNVALTTIPQQQPVIQPSQCSCGNCKALAQWERLFYDTSIWQYPLHYRHFNRSY